MAKGGDIKHTKLDSRILDCKCTANLLKSTAAADFQNSKYGKGKRVHNPSAKGFSCTVCGDLKPLDIPKEEKKK